jgi:hypothetical protein
MAFGGFVAKLDGGRAWADVAAMARGHVELLIVIGGLFIMLPSLMSDLFIPFVPVGKTIAEVVSERLAYTEANLLPLLLNVIIATFGQATILALLIDPARPTVGRSLRIGLANLFWLLLANLIVSFAVGAGLTLFIVPGLYLFGRLMPVPAILFAERRTRPADLIRRSFALTKESAWRNLLFFLVIWMTATVVVIAVGSVTGIAASIAGGPVSVFLRSLVSASLDASFALLLLLAYVAVYRQLAAR